MAHSCDPLRKLFGVWQNNVPMKFSYFLPLPLKGEEAAWNYFREELLLLKKHLKPGSDQDSSLFGNLVKANNWNH